MILQLVQAIQSQKRHPVRKSIMCDHEGTELEVYFFYIEFCVLLLK